MEDLHASNDHFMYTAMTTNFCHIQAVALYTNLDGDSSEIVVDGRFYVIKIKIKVIPLVPISPKSFDDVMQSPYLYINQISKIHSLPNSYPFRGSYIMEES